mmetsp:Transcript_36151/g.80446  ORF Transcript_36151/g.80446 Transcript_36151/m.80446 type:complete len:469 (-) Transcript_36151:811-2217(-)
MMSARGPVPLSGPLPRMGLLLALLAACMLAAAAPSRAQAAAASASERTLLAADPDKLPYLNNAKKGKLQVVDAAGQLTSLTFDISAPAPKDRKIKVQFETRVSEQPADQRTTIISLSEGATTFTVKFSGQDPPLCSTEAGGDVPADKPKAVKKKGKGVIDIDGVEVEVEEGSGKVKSFKGKDGALVRVAAQSDEVPPQELSFPICHKGVCVEKADCKPAEPHRGQTFPDDAVPANPGTRKLRAATSSLSSSEVPGAAASRSLLQNCDFVTAAVTFFNTGGRYGNWCGVGGSANSTCPGQICQDGGMDACCFRHDMSRYNEPGSFLGVSLTYSPCKVDHDFRFNCIGLIQDSSTQDAKNAATGAACVFATIPCLNYVQETYWTWCSWLPCTKTRWIWDKYYTSYGPMTCNGDCYKLKAGSSSVNDGRCDASLNSADGAWDGGDCCAETCHKSRTYSCGVTPGYNCLSRS